MSDEPTEAQIIRACYAHSPYFAMMDGPERVQMMHEARWWLKVWDYVRAAQPDTTPAPDQPAEPQPGPQ